MSKKMGFPVLSLTITGVLFIVALILGTLTLFITGLIPGGYLDAKTAGMLNGLLLFIGAILAAFALISYVLHPDLEEGQKFIVSLFLILLLLAFFAATTSLTFTFR